MLRQTVWKALACLALLLSATAEAAKQKDQTLQSLVYPWPSRPDWPSLKMSYNYLVSGTISGTEIVKDGTYSYSRGKGYDEPEIDQTFEYYTQLKVDSENGRAVQKLWTDATRAVPLSTSAIDFENARMMFVEYKNGREGPGECRVVQFQDTLMDSRQMLEWIWQPRAQSPVTFMGTQCLSKENQQVFGFKGVDAGGISWQTFFDIVSRAPVYAKSGGSEEDGSTPIEFSIDRYRVISSFAGQDADFYPAECIADYSFEVVDQSMMGTGEFGLFLM